MARGVRTLNSWRALTERTSLDSTSTVDAVTFKQSDLLKHVTYRDKQATLLVWLSLSADPVGWGHGR